MKLSVTKLNTLLEKRQLSPIYYFTIDNYCSFVLIKCRKSGESCVLYVQSTYEVRLAPDNERVFDIKYYDIDDIKKNFEDEEDIKFESIFLPDKKINLENTETLLKNYKSVISTESKEQHFKRVDVLTNQMKRVRLCLEKNRYKCILFHHRFLICLHRDNRVESYMSPSFLFSKDIEFKISFDLETFLEKISSISFDIPFIRTNIYRIFNSNIRTHLKKLINILSHSTSIIQKCNQNIQKKNDYKKQLKKFKSLVEPLNGQIDTYKKQLEVNKRQGSFNKNLGIEHKLGKLLKKREEVTVNITELHSITDHYIFNMDNLLFNNLIHINTILKNLENI